MRHFFTILLLLTSAGLWAQPLSLSLLYGPPSDPPEKWSTGNVFQVGSEVGDASIYALFAGAGTQSFQILSPGENLTKTVTGSGYFNIRPTVSTVVDQTKVLNFGGTVTGSVNVTVKPLSISTILQLTAAVQPGATLPVTFLVGVGTFPVGTGFAVQLLTTDGAFIQTLASTPAYTTREPTTYSSGDERAIPATLPGNLAPGAYRVRVVTTGLNTTAFGTNSAAITVQTPTQQTPITTLITDVSPHTICTGYSGTVQLTWTATDDGQQAQRYTIGVYAANATTADVPLRTITNQGVYSQSSGNTKTLTATTSQLNSLGVGQYKLGIVHQTITTNLNFSNPFVVQAGPSVVISDDSPNVNAGQGATVRLTFSGAGPWSYSYDNLRDGVQTVTGQTTNPATIMLYPSGDYLFSTDRLLTFSGLCGNGSKSGSSQLRVTQLGLTLTSVGLPNACPGSTLTANFTVNGTVPTSTRYRLQFSDASGSFANPRELASGTSSPLSGQTPSNDAPGTRYRARIVSDYGPLPTSNELTVTLSRPDLPGVTAYSFCQGGTVPTLTATGADLQWYSTDGTGGNLGRTAPIPPNDRSSSYRVTQTVNGCQSSPALVTVIARTKSALPTVQSPVNVCQGQPATGLTAQGSNLLWFNSTGQSLGANGPIPGTGSAGSQTFFVSQDANGCRSDQATVTVTVTAQPSAPVVVSPLNVCQGTTAFSLSATGENLRWYDTPDASGPARDRLTITPTSAGVSSYYVRQTVNGCPGALSRLEVRVSQMARATLSGDSIVTLFDSTAIRIRFSGEAPYRVTLWSGKVVTTTDNPLIVWEKPTSSATVYALRSLENNCGPGNPGNAYRLVVRTPLANEPLPAGKNLRVQAYPNPANGPLTVIWQAPNRESVYLQLVSLSGQLIWQRNSRGTGQPETETVPTTRLAPGLYGLLLTTEAAGRVQTRVVVVN